MRAHMVLPEALVKQVDAVVGKRKRSRFVEEAVREKLRREGLLAALKETAGALSEESHPEWATSEKAAAWVRESRRQDEEHAVKARRG
jgi:metal-responsive CopG/Arc/MetJ family transcriptional regulator